MREKRPENWKYDRIVEGLIWTVELIFSKRGLILAMAGLFGWAAFVYQPSILANLNASATYTIPGGHNCGYWKACLDIQGNVTAVRDYEVDCSGLLSHGTCPREDVTVRPIYGNVSTDCQFTAGCPMNIYLIPSTFVQTLNCHYYRVGDIVPVTEVVTQSAVIPPPGSGNEKPLPVQTNVSFNINGGPC